MSRALWSRFFLPAAPAEEADTEVEQDQSGEQAEPVVDEDRVAADEEWTTSMEEYKSLVGGSLSLYVYLSVVCLLLGRGW